jgi:hypothetical protein
MVIGEAKVHCALHLLIFIGQLTTVENLMMLVRY